MENVNEKKLMCNNRKSNSRYISSAETKRGVFIATRPYAESRWPIIILIIGREKKTWKRTTGGKKIEMGTRSRFYCQRSERRRTGTRDFTIVSILYRPRDLLKVTTVTLMNWWAEKKKNPGDECDRLIHFFFFLKVYKNLVVINQVCLQKRIPQYWFSG